MYRIGGSLRSKDVSLYGDAVGIPLLGHWVSNLRPLAGRGTMSGGEFDWGGRLRKSIRGAQRFPQDGRKQGSLTATPTGGAGTKVGLSDPVADSGIAIAQRIKATLGITG